MLSRLSWDDYNWRSMFHTWMIYYNALTVVMRRWQLTEQDSWLRYILPCSDRCHQTMTTNGACLIPKGCLTMPCPLSWDDDNWCSMFHIWMISYHALTVVMRRWQLTEQDSYLRDISPCPDRCHETMTTDGAWLIPKGYIIMLWPLSWDDDNWRSMFHTWMIYNHSLTVVIRRWQLMEHDSYQGIYYHALTVVLRRWQLMEHVHTLGMNNNALFAGMTRWQLTEHVSYMRNTLPCYDRCH